MPKLIDISGRRFGNAVVEFRHGVDTTNKTTWRCVCDCGQVFVATGANLKNGNTKSCGCLRNEPAYENRSGTKYGRLTAISVAKRERGKVWWRCKCDCGNDTTVSVAHLIAGHTQSCGCLGAEVWSANAKTNLGGVKQNHPRWRDDLSEIDRDKIRSDEVRLWSVNVKKADGYQCVVCGATGHLHSHHLYGYSDVAVRRADPSNGVCLCTECHRSFHKKYGYKGFTREQFFEFAGMDDPGDFSIVGQLDDDNLRAAFNLLTRCDLKQDAIEDLEKARWYIDREIKKRKRVRVTE